MTLPLFDYQQSAALMMAGQSRFGLHDEMGIGKTATTIGAINASLATRCMIVAPAMLRENWIKEFDKFSTYPLRTVKAKTVHDFIAWQRGRFDVLITSYEGAVKYAKDFRKRGEFIDVIGMDEAHYLKNDEANRTRAILGRDSSGGFDSIVGYAEHAYHITGTPMADNPLDLYTFLKFSNRIDRNFNEFVDRYFSKEVGTFKVKYSPNPVMLPELKALLADARIARTHKDVGLELPPIWLKEVLLEGGAIDLGELEANYPHLEQRIVEAIETNNIGLLELDYMSTVRRLVGKAKAQPYSKLLVDELDNGSGKRVVFCAHTEPLLYVHQYLEKHGYKSVVAYGDTTERDRQEAVRSFMEDPTVKVFIGNIKVAGVGLTLTESSEIDILESDWSPANNAQAIKRVHRYGQKNEVHARFITLANSIDVAVNKTVARKTASIAEIEGFSMTSSVPLDGSGSPR